MKNFLILMILMIPLISCQGIPSDKQTITAPEDGFSDQILQATLFIDVQAIQSDVMSLEHSVGTLVQFQGGIYLVTHNHFGDAWGDTSTIEFRDAKNRMIIPISGFEFKSRIVYQDPGTLVLRAPDVLTDVLTPVNLLSQPQLEPGDIVQIIHRSEPSHYKIETLTAIVEEINTYESTPVYILRSLDGQSLVPGDSGGGVWFDGTLIANSWAVSSTGSTLSTSGSSDTTHQTEIDLNVVAAVFPDLNILSSHTTP